MIAAEPIAVSRKVHSLWGVPDDNGVITYDLHSGQRDVLAHPARFKAAVAGTGGGKTAIGPLWVIQQIHRVLQSGRNLKREPILGMVCAPTHEIKFRATAPTFVNMLEGTDLEGEYIESRNRYILPDGIGTIWMMSADSPGGLEGGQFDFAWLDEAGQMKYQAWVAIQGRTGMRQAPVLITTTPYAVDWLYHRFFKLAQAGDKDYYVRQWSSVENPAYPQEEYERAKRQLSPQRFAMRYDGDFVKLAGLVYPDFDSCIVDFNSYPEGELLHYGGMDWGWNPDPFAAVAGVLDEDDCLWMWYERYIRNERIAVHSQKVPKGVEWWADQSNPEGIAEMQAAGHVVHANAIKAVHVGIEAVQSRIYRGKARIHPRLRALISNAREYRYPEKDDEIQAADPIGEHHALDAMRYLVANVDRHSMAWSEQATRQARMLA